MRDRQVDSPAAAQRGALLVPTLSGTTESSTPGLVGEAKTIPPGSGWRGTVRQPERSRARPNRSARRSGADMEGGPGKYANFSMFFRPVRRVNLFLVPALVRAQVERGMP